MLNQRPGHRRVDTRYTGPERRIPLDSEALRAVVLTTLAFWVVVGLAIWGLWK